MQYPPNRPPHDPNQPHYPQQYPPPYNVNVPVNVPVVVNVKQKGGGGFFSTTFGVIAGLFTCCIIMPVLAFFVLMVLGAIGRANSPTSGSTHTTGGTYQ